MKRNIRIIPRLDIKGPNLVKGIHLEGLRVLGTPENFARFYYEQGADELFYMDVVASLYGRNNIQHIISQTAKNIFIPITVGGGLRTTSDMSNVLKAGADKVCLNTAAIANPNIIKEAATKFGSSTIVIAIEAIKQTDGRYLCFVDNGREWTGIEAIEWAQRAAELGAGELVVTSVDQEGTGEGFDINLVRSIANLVNIPVIAHGGAGNLNHVTQLLNETETSAVALSSMLHYYCLKNNCVVQSSDQNEGNTVFLKSGALSKKITGHTLHQVKEAVAQSGFQCRITP